MSPQITQSRRKCCRTITIEVLNEFFFFLLHIYFTSLSLYRLLHLSLSWLLIRIQWHKRWKYEEGGRKLHIGIDGNYDVGLMVLMVCVVLVV